MKRPYEDLEERFSRTRNKSEEVVTKWFKDLGYKIWNANFESRCKIIALERLEESYLWLFQGMPPDFWEREPTIEEIWEEDKRLLDEIPED